LQPPIEEVLLRPTGGSDGYLRLRLAAGLGLLQPGIDPVFLVLLSANSDVAPTSHGLVVGVAQAGMAAGALLVMRSRQPAWLWLAGSAGTIAALATVFADSLLAVLALRAVFGLATGMIYAAALRDATATARAPTPAHAMGTILLAQLALATLVALLLPVVANIAGPATALLCLAVVPITATWLLAPDRDAPPESFAEIGAPQHLSPAMVAVFLFVAASAMIWSHVGAGAIVAGFSNQIVGLAVALGSVAAGVAALVVARATPRLPLPASAALTGLAMAAPLLMTGSAAAYVAAMIAFNIGATYAVARFSAVAIGQGERAVVAAVQAVAMVAGPLVGAAAVALGGAPALGFVAVLALAGAVCAIFVNARSHGGAKVIAPTRLLHDDLVANGP
jgi:hypothetical protein